MIAAGIYLAIEVRASPAAPAPAPVATRSPTHPEGSESSASGDDAPGSSTHVRKPGKGLRTGIPSGSDLVRAAGSDLGPAPSLEAGSNEKLDAAKVLQVVAEAYSAYDRQEFEEAKASAAKALASDPKNVRALRIMVSTSCIEGSAVDAQKYFDQLPEGQDRADMRKRCGRDYNIVFK